MITGIKNIMVTTIEMKALIREVPTNKYEMTNAAKANAIPTA